VAVERVVSGHDMGRAINILSLTGQIEGGMVMGIGNALTEHYIEENGDPGRSTSASTRCRASSTCRR
jgi:CO/xanthine dehydrogenase Mo-binding subunit